MASRGRYCEVIHTRAFTSTAADTLTEDQIAALELRLATDPEAGDIMPGTAGVRKIRVAAKGHGRRGGARVVYLFVPSREVIYLFALYVKGDRAKLTKREEMQLRKYAERLKKGAD
jgi:hypothetical protein